MGLAQNTTEGQPRESYAKTSEIQRFYSLVPRLSPNFRRQNLGRGLRTRLEV